jgi:hypothetical protein
VPICTVAFWALASRQLTEDSAAFQMFLNGEMTNGLNAKLDDEVVNGSGISPHMNGLANVERLGCRPRARSVLTR